MTERDENAKLIELERLLNDPDAPREPGRIWTLVDELMELEAA